MTPVSSARTAKISVLWIEDQWKLASGGMLPVIKSGARAELVIPLEYLANEGDRERWSTESTILMLKKETELFACVTLSNVPVAERRKLEKIPYAKASRGYVKIVLGGDLSLAVSPGRKGKLNDCVCKIPDLNETALSVNEAYKKITSVFEPERRSNAGNVFSLVWLYEGVNLVSLDDIRMRLTGDAPSVADDEGREPATRTQQERQPRRSKKKPARGQQEMKF